MGSVVWSRYSSSCGVCSEEIVESAVEKLWGCRVCCGEIVGGRVCSEEIVGSAVWSRYSSSCGVCSEEIVESAVEKLWGCRVCCGEIVGV